MLELCNKNSPACTSQDYLAATQPEFQATARQAGTARRSALRHHFWPWLLISPWLLGLVFFTIGPLLYSLIISFYDWPLLESARFVGWENYRHMWFDDADFWDALSLTCKFAAMYVPLCISFALLLALLLNLKLAGQGIFRTLFYLPSIISGVALVGIFSSMYHRQYGVLNFLLESLGLSAVDWLGSPEWAMPSILLASLWSVGGSMLVFLAGLKNIPADLYEAARLAGVPAWARFFHITLPLLSPVLLFNTITTLLAAFQQLTLALLLTKGGPVNSTHFLAMYIYNTAFRYFDMGYAAAMSWFLFVLMLIGTGILLAIAKRWSYQA